MVSEDTGSDILGGENQRWWNIFWRCIFRATWETSANDRQIVLNVLDVGCHREGKK